MTVMSAQRSRSSRPFIALGITAGCYAVSCLSSALQLGFVSGGLIQNRAVGVSRADGSMERYGSLERTIPKWQDGLDTAYFDHEATPIQRVNGLTKYFAEGGNLGIVKKVILAINILHEKGASGGPEALDLLFPKGLHLRADVDAWLDLFEKLPTSRLIKELEQLRDDLEKEGVTAPQELTEFAKSIEERLLPVGAEQATDRASHMFRKLPRADREEIEYIVVYSNKDYEVRAYQPFRVARTPILGDKNSMADVFASTLAGRKTSIGEAFQSIVEYVDKQKDSVKVLYPIVTDYQKHEHMPTGMSLPLEVADDRKVHLESRVSYAKAKMQLVAVRTFLGFASDVEIRDQYEQLKKSMLADGAYDAYKDGSFSLMQYNAPRMMPWRRRNEIGIPVQSPKRF